MEIIKTDPNSIGGKIKIARKLYSLTLEEMSKLTGISVPTIHELETFSYTCISRPTLNKLVNIFPEELILTDYYKFVYKQKEYLKNIDTQYLSTLFDVNPSTVERWKKEIYIVKENFYVIMKELGIIP